LDASLIGRCPHQAWEGLQTTLASCLELPGGATLRNRAGRTLELAVPEGRQPYAARIVALCPPALASTLFADGWYRAGKGQGQVSRNGRDTGTDAGKRMARELQGSPEELAAVVAGLLRDLLSVKGSQDLLFFAETQSWARLLREPAPGYAKRWHHAPDKPADGTGAGGTGRSEGHQWCRKCGQPLTTPESLERGYGPECWKQMQGRPIRERRF
jgi:hypothetical protein